MKSTSRSQRLRSAILLRSALLDHLNAPQAHLILLAHQTPSVAASAYHRLFHIMCPARGMSWDRPRGHVGYVGHMAHMGIVTQVVAGPPRLEHDTHKTREVALAEGLAYLRDRHPEETYIFPSVHPDIDVYRNMVKRFAEQIADHGGRVVWCDYAAFEAKLVSGTESYSLALRDARVCKTAIVQPCVTGGGDPFSGAIAIDKECEGLLGHDLSGAPTGTVCHTGALVHRCTPTPAVVLQAAVPHGGNEEQVVKVLTTLTRACDSRYTTLYIPVSLRQALCHSVDTTYIYTQWKERQDATIIDTGTMPRGPAVTSTPTSTSQRRIPQYFSKITVT